MRCMHACMRPLARAQVVLGLTVVAAGLYLSWPRLTSLYTRWWAASEERRREQAEAERQATKAAIREAVAEAQEEIRAVAGELREAAKAARDQQAEG